MNSSFEKYLKKTLPLKDSGDLVESFNECSFPIASHDSNGLFNYLNKAALSIFKVSLDQVIGKPSTMTAPESEQKERNTLLNQVNSHGFIKNYKGVRVASDGKLFQIKDATIWNIVDKESIKIGQAVIIYRSNKL
ncbi:MEKHLA domain-containing protein [Methylophilaceae bacterium]|nr:MEKHLA domain-containing protein [Methylophilaceae bacterium]